MCNRIINNKSNILIVDDTVASLKLASDILTAEGYQVRSAITGELALESAVEHPPDLVLLDILMPRMNGFEVCEKLKAHSNTRNVPVIFVSALPDTKDKVRGFALGAVDFLTKPYQREELLARVQTHLEVNRLRNHLEDMVKERSAELNASEALLKSSLERLTQANAQLRTLLNTIPDLVWLKDPDGVFLACNLQFERLLGTKEANIIGKTDYDFLEQKQADFFRENDRKAILSAKVVSNEEWITFAENGYCGLFEALKTPMYDNTGKLIGVLGIARDITERHAAEAKIQRHMRLYAAVNDCNKAIVHSTNETELFLKICKAAVLSGGMKTAWVGLIDPQTCMVLPVASFGDGADQLQNIQVSADADNPYGNGPCGVSIREQQPYWCLDYINDPATVPWHALSSEFGWSASASLPLSRDGQVVGAFILYSEKPNAFDDDTRDLLEGMAQDISFTLDNFSREIARHKAEDEIARLAFYDPLTGLPNRRLLLDRLQQSLVDSERHPDYGAVMFIDLDNFKALNDTKGHSLGDLLLQEVASRIQGCLRIGDTVARLGGDEFVVILDHLSDDITTAGVQAEAIGNKILDAISRSYELQEYEHYCSASMGIELFHNNNNSAGELLKYTDIAMYQAKRNGRNSLLFFDPAMESALEAHMVLEKDLRSALAENQFELYYQLQVDKDRKIVGSEALIRWHHPQRGLVSPIEFIPLAEETGLIIPIGKWVLEAACAQLKKWKNSPFTHSLQVAVNVSASQFHQHDFVDQVREVLNRYQLNSEQLKLELTESLILKDIEDTIVKMHQLRELGVSFSLDDFGTGNSSLYYLSKLPIHQLKIDQSFVRNINKQTSDTIIVQTIIAMANSLGLESLAEGVETEEQYRFLTELGCKLYQGYWFGKPVPLDKFETLIQIDTSQAAC
ncbi:MAG: response regulator receiver protein [Methylobacter sp.]|nr:MAG: response regulator receiver protein [Methylobacter sp.]PPD04289.1 MAG: response regulator receiver protein [Methylobacter sp.]